MKKWIICLSAFALMACSEKDKEYYLSHADQAQEKVKQCRQQQEQAFSNNDKQKFRQIEQDKECQAAREAVKEHRRQQAEKERLEREAQEKAAIEQAKQKFNTEFGQLNWQQFAPHFVNHQCGKMYIGNKDFECRAFKELYDEKVAQAKSELGKLNFADLLAQEKQYCSRDKRQYSTCWIWEQALEEVGKAHFSSLPFAQSAEFESALCVYDGRSLAACNTWRTVSREQEKQIIKAYTQNYESLKQDYNQCVQRLAEIADTWKNHEKRMQISDKYPCPQAKSARSELGLPYDNFKTLME